MGNFCSQGEKEPKKAKAKTEDTKKKDAKDKGQVTNKNAAKSSKYAVAMSPSSAEGGAAAASDTNADGFSVLPPAEEDGSSQQPNQQQQSQAAPAAALAQPAAPAPATRVFAPNPALAKASSYAVVPPCENAVIKQNSRNPADYEADGLVGAVWTRVPGEINDQRINIANCRDCTFILLDQCDSVQIDDCEGCRFFIGPTAGSVFIRTSKNCKVIAACGQLRTREVFDSTLALFCHSRPVIESSRGVRIACYPSTHGYGQLLHHMCKSRLSQFTNLWPFVHDFTPSKKAGELNYCIVPQAEVEAEDFFPSISGLMPDVLSAEADAALRASAVVIPFTTWHTAENAASSGAAALPYATLLIFRPGAVDAARAVVEDIEARRRFGSPFAWHALVEHQFKGPVDASTAAALGQLGVPSRDVAALNGHSFIMGVYGHAEEVGLPSAAMPSDQNVLFRGPVPPASPAYLKLFADLPTQGKGFGASH